jgi:pyruvate, water dikinase
VPPGVALPVDLVAAVAGELPAGADAVRAAARDLGGPLAVRSSAAGEDGGAVSSAGQLLTVLGVRDPDGVVAAVARVAASTTADSAVAYRRVRGAGPAVCCGVVLQRMEPAVAAGVLFSRHPVTGRDEVIVEASWGLGIAVGEGLVVPDLFRLDRAGRLVEQVPGRKDQAVVPAPEGGTTVTAVPPDRVWRPCLGGAELAELAALARRCDELFGTPSDLEWLWNGTRVVLLQRRPITTLSGPR